MTRILFFSYASRMGGAEHSLLEFLKIINREKYAPVLLHAEKGELADRVSALGIQTIHLPFRFNIETFTRNNLFGQLLMNPGLIMKMLKWRSRFRKLIVEQSIGCIHCNQPKSHILTMLTAPSNVPYVLHLRDIFPGSSLSSQIYRILFSKRQGFCIAISEAVADSFPVSLRQKTRVVHNGVRIPDTVPSMEEARQRLSIQRTGPVIFSAGRLVPWKQFDLLIRAFAQISASFPNARLIIAGDALYGAAAYPDQLKNLAEETGCLSCITFAGHIQDLTDYFSACTLFANASRNEPFGRVIIEAMAHGKPVVAFRTGGIPEIVRHGETGLLADRQTSAALADAMKKILSAKDVCEQMGRAGLETVRREFSVQKNKAAAEAYLDEICGGRK